MSHVANDGPDAKREAAFLDALLQSLNARRMAIDCQDGSNPKLFDEMEGLATYTAPQVEDRGRFLQFTQRRRALAAQARLPGP